MFSFLCSRNVSICTLPARGQCQVALSHWTSSDPTCLKRLLHSFDHDNRSSENSTDGVKNKECDHGKLAKLDECRGVIRLGGDHLVHFLQGLLTNDVELFQSSADASMYACILNAQGRYLHDVFLHKYTYETGKDAIQTCRAYSEEEVLKEVYLDVDAAGKPDFIRLLKRYRLRQKVDIDDVSSEFSVWTRFFPDRNLFQNENRSSKIGWNVDPRLSHLGFRSILNNSHKVSEHSLGEQVHWEEFKKWRIRNGVAEGDKEIPSGESIALEYNIDGLNGISFKKGCYVGQELMARTHFKGVVRKRLMPFEIKNGSTKDGDVIIGFTGKESSQSKAKSIGSVRVVHGSIGLAILRLKEGLQSIGSQHAFLTDSGAQVQPWKPSWWPEDWSRDV